MINFLFETAYAQAANGAPQAGPSMVELLAMPAVLLIIMYFFIIRPQQRRAKEHATLMNGLKAGDEVVTTGGLIGRIKAVAEGFVTMEVSPNTSVKVLKSSVTGLTKGMEKPQKA